MEIPSYTARSLSKQSIPVNFAGGLDTKTDPNQINLQNFLTLTNSVFTTGGRLTKRNGFSNITTVPISDQTTLLTYKGNLVTTGSSLYTYNIETNAWYDKGTIQPIQLSTTSLVRTGTSQSSPDLAVASSGLGCLVFMDSSAAYYQIVDSLTGETVVNRTALPDTASNPRVFILGSYFLITFTAAVAGTNYLQMIGVPISSPLNSTSVITISNTITSLSTGYDAVSIADQLYIMWAESSTALGLAYITSALAVSPVTVISNQTATLVAACVDITTNLPTLYFTFYDGTDTYVTAYDTTLTQTFAPVKIVSAVTLDNVTASATAGSCTVLYSVHNSYSTPMTGQSDYIQKVIISKAGSITTTSTTILRSVSLVSRAFLDTNNVEYALVAYGPSGSNQPSYFLMDSNGNLYMRLAYSNGGGYPGTQVLATVSSYQNSYYVPYLLVDLLATVNKTTSVPPPAQISAIYTQTGISLATIGINDSNQYSVEVADALQLTGGQVWEFDGVKAVEHGFHVWPENITVVPTQTVGSLTPGTYFYAFTYEWTDNQGNLHRSAPSIPVQYVIDTPPTTFTVATTSGSADLTFVSDFTGLQVGQILSGTGIPTGSYIISLDVTTSTLTISQNATGTAATITVTPTAISEVKCYVPTLRLTYKTGINPVRIVGYRWSAAQEIYFQFTSLTSPILNDTTTDNVTITDSQADSAISGNVILYTTGGVVENIAAPASKHVTMYQDRVFLIDAEDPNLLWYSKQIIESTPVEFSDLFTLYVAPTLGAQGSTGPLTAIFPMDDKLILFKKDAIYYVTGAGPDNTGANDQFSDAIFITTAVGCDNPISIVLTPNGLMFQSDKGIWLLGRDLNTNYIGANVEGYNASLVTSATLIPGTTQVRFMLDSGLTLMYDYYFNQWGTFSNILPLSGTLYNGLHTYLNSKGQIFQETPGIYTDGSVPVLMGFTTAWMNVAGLRGFQRFYQMLLLGTYFTPFKLNAQLAYDYGYPEQSIIVTPDNYNPNWGDDPVWGSNQGWGGIGNSFQVRIFPKKQKCQTFQLAIQEVYDSTYKVPPGQGLSLSGMNIVVGVKKGFSPQSSGRSFG
jgi:hypothetical protein